MRLAGACAHEPGFSYRSRVVWVVSADTPAPCARAVAAASRNRERERPFTKDTNARSEMRSRGPGRNHDVNRR